MIAATSSASTESRCKLLFEAERLLAHAAKSEEGARSVTAHLFNIGTSLALGLIMAYALQRPSAAPINMTMGLFIGEMGINTRPTHASRSLERYRQGVLTAAPPPGFLNIFPSVSASATETRVGLVGTF